MKIHISKMRDYSAERGGWPSHNSLGTRCGRRLPQNFTSRRSRATCKACLKAHA